MSEEWFVRVLTRVQARCPNGHGFKTDVLIPPGSATGLVCPRCARRVVLKVEAGKLAFADAGVQIEVPA